MLKATAASIGPPSDMRETSVRAAELKNLDPLRTAAAIMCDKNSF
jgi:hypothetical protein